MKSLLTHPTEKGLLGLFNDSFPPILDGVTLTVENYARWFQQAGRQPCVVTPWNPVSVEREYDVMRFFSLPIRNRHPYRYGYPKLDPFIWKRLRDTDFRIVHAHCPFSSGRLALYVKKRQGVPLVGTFHSKYRQDLEHSFKHTPWFVPIIMKRILAFFNACDEVWIPQAQVEETVREYGYRGRLQVVENGNDFARSVTGDLFDYKQDARRRVGMKEEDINLLFVGQHIWEKGLRTIVDALRLLGNDVPFSMNFIGNGYAADELRNLVKEYGLSDRVRINGIVTDRNRLSDYYAASDLFVFPSYYDNAPLVVREAAAMGTPAIVPRGSTASEVISDGRNGFLADNDARHFAGVIRHLQADRDALRLAARGARDTLVRSWEDIAGEVLDRYEVILKNHKR